MKTISHDRKFLKKDFTKNPNKIDDFDYTQKNNSNQKKDSSKNNFNNAFAEKKRKKKL